MNFICFLSLDTVVSGGVVLVEWFIDFLRLCAVKSVHQGKAGAEFCGGGESNRGDRVDNITKVEECDAI